MFKKYRFVFLALILASYCLLYIATTKKYVCDEDCETMNVVDSLIRDNRDYVELVNKCYNPVKSDTICVWVRDTVGIDWNLLADTVCQVATSKGLLRQKILVLKPTSTGYPDTVVKKQCP